MITINTSPKVIKIRHIKRVQTKSRVGYSAITKSYQVIYVSDNIPQFMKSLHWQNIHDLERVIDRSIK